MVERPLVRRLRLLTTPSTGALVTVHPEVHEARQAEVEACDGGEVDIGRCMPPYVRLSPPDQDAA